MLGDAPGVRSRPARRSCRVGVPARHGLLRVPFRGGRPPPDRRRSARLSERRARARRRALAHPGGPRRAPVNRSWYRLLHNSTPALRDRLRSTALHNTLVVDGRSQSLPAGPSTGRTSPTGGCIAGGPHPAFDYFDGSHDGYRPIEASPPRAGVARRSGRRGADFVAGSGAHAAAPSTGTSIRAGRWRRGHERGLDDVPRAGPIASACRFPKASSTTSAAHDLTGLGWCSPAYGRIDRATTVRIAHDATSRRSGW